MPKDIKNKACPKKELKGESNSKCFYNLANIFLNLLHLVNLLKIINFGRQIKLDLNTIT